MLPHNTTPARELKGKSIIALPSDFVVIDTETTGLDYNFCNLIEVSAMRFCHGTCVETFSSLIRPPLRFFRRWTEDGTEEYIEGYVDDFIASLTGITNEMLTDAPLPEIIIPQFLDFIGDSVLVGHNAHFDINFLYDAAIDVCGEPLKNDFIDTLRIARKVFPELVHHRLTDVAQACNITIGDTHRAEADCKLTAACYLHMRSHILEESTEDDFIELFNYNYKKILSSVTANVAQIDDTNPIYGKVVVFTGALSSLTRKDAFQIVANLGGVPQDSINKKTNYLVIGNYDFAKSVKEGKTNKMKKAEGLLQKGTEITIVSESAFFDLIAGYL